MKKITEEAVWEERNKTKRNTTNGKEQPIPRRLQFQNYKGVQKEKDRPTFSVPFECVKKIFVAQTGLSLRYNDNPVFKNYWKDANEKEIPLIEAWEKEQGRRVFLRDCLSLSIALDLNLLEPGKYTRIGDLENQGKKHQNLGAIKQLAEAVVKEINELPFYKEADLVCAVPSREDKGFDFPGDVTSLVSAKIGKPNVTKGFNFGEQKLSITTSSVDKKWGVWEKADISFDISKFDVNGKTIILIDDKYQSGTTIQYVAMKLQEAGANQVYGLCLVKTLRDTDNK